MPIKSDQALGKLCFSKKTECKVVCVCGGGGGVKTLWLASAYLRKDMGEWGGEEAF